MPVQMVPEDFEIQSSWRWLQAKRTLVLHVFILDRPIPMPEREASGDDDSDQDTDQEKQSVSGQGDEQDYDYRNSREQRG